MKVKELIAELLRHDQEAEVAGGVRRENCIWAIEGVTLTAESQDTWISYPFEWPAVLIVVD